MPDPPGTSCNVDGSFQSVDLCGAVSAADRAAVRQAVLKGCFPSQDPAVIDFSRLP
jgi:hypothetical protein